MRVVLVGADFEENLGVGMIAAAASAAGHTVRVEPFDTPEQLRAVARRVAARRPEVVGLSMQFQHRGHEFLRLARALRREGCDAHLTAGGQFATLAWQSVLSPPNAVDSVVLYEGEQTFVDLLEALAGGSGPSGVRGLGLPGPDGPVRTTPRPIAHDLDDLPFAARYRPHARHLGVPFIPVMGSRGCWGACSYCSITSFYRDARRAGGGRTFRERSPEDVAEEMAALWHAAGGPSIFCFHDDNMLRPRPEHTLERMLAIRGALDEHDVGKVGFIGKCRPDCLTPALARSLAELGVIRLYVGVENASEAGAQHLRRGRQTAHVHTALEACRRAGIFVCYNLLVFEPDTVLDDLRANIEFIRAHAIHPVNFCRAEPYSGTPLQLDLGVRGALGGSYLGWDYRIDDPRAELMFRICAAAFRQRNFDPSGVANRYMGLGYSLKVLRHFHADVDHRFLELAAKADALTRSISIETADLLEEALELASVLPLDDPDRALRSTALLGLRVAAADAAQHAALDRLYDEMQACTTARPRSRRRVPRRLVDLAQRLALGASLAVSANACVQQHTVDPVPGDGGQDDDGPLLVDPLPPDFFVADPLPGDQGVDAIRDWGVDPLPDDAGRDVWVVDPPPRDASVDADPDWQVVDPPPPDAAFDAAPDAHPDWLIVDPPPPDAALDVAPEAGPDARPDARPDWQIVDPPPPDAPIAPDASAANDPVIDQWRDTAPRRAARSADIPLSEPPSVRLVAQRDADGVRVVVHGGPPAMTTRWEGDGQFDAEGREARWQPEHPNDQIRVAVRAPRGIAVVALRAKDVDG